jgi:hypothetical protein
MERMAPMLKFPDLRLLLPVAVEKLVLVPDTKSIMKLS